VEQTLVFSSLFFVTLSVCVTISLVNYVDLFIIELKIRDHLNNWEDNPYVRGKHDCSDMSLEVETFFETKTGYDCYLVYGYNKKTNVGHMWNIVLINNHWYEFESTCLSFQKSSDDYIILDIQNGFFINGVKYEKCQPYKNWEEEIKL